MNAFWMVGVWIGVTVPFWLTRPAFVTENAPRLFGAYGGLIAGALVGHFLSRETGVWWVEYVLPWLVVPFTAAATVREAGQSSDRGVP